VLLRGQHDADRERDQVGDGDPLRHRAVPRGAVKQRIPRLLQRPRARVLAEILSQALGTRLSAPDMTEEEALAAGMPPMGASHERLNVVGQPGRPQYARDLGIPLTPFEQWAQHHLPPTP
jgi:hypothetical protein